jgi:hypothetical protein
METVELQRQKNSKNRRTPTTMEPQFFKYLKKNIIAFDSGTPTTVGLKRHKNFSFKNYQKYRTIELQCPTVELQ